MPITQAQRHHLLTQLEATIGKEAAMTLADHLPPVGWADVATKADLDHLATEIRGELRVGLAEVRTEMAMLRGDVHAEIGGVRAEMAKQTRHVAVALVSAVGVLLAGMQVLG